MFCTLRRVLVWGGCLLAWPAQAPAQAPVPTQADAGWQLIKDSEGIATYRRDHADHTVAFRGVASVPADVYRTMAALLDEAHATTWVHHCVAAQIVDHRRPLQWLTYRRNIAGAPFVADRDMLLDVRLSAAAATAAGPRLTLAFAKAQDDSRRPPPSGVVRIAAIAGHFQCEPAQPGQTQVTYQVAVDPGGQLPAWLVRRATADLPRLTLLGLRKAVLAEHLAPMAAAVAAELAVPSR